MEKLDPEEVKEITTRIFGKVAGVVVRSSGDGQTREGEGALGAG